MAVLVISVEGDQSDLDFLRTRAVSAVEELVEDIKEEGRLDSDVDVSWDYEE